jgi:hypothetical protein
VTEGPAGTVRKHLNPMPESHETNNAQLEAFSVTSSLFNILSFTLLATSTRPKVFQKEACAEVADG